MSRRNHVFATLLAALKPAMLAVALFGAQVQAQDLLIKHATVHTAGARGTLKDADVLVQGGLIRAVGSGLLITPGITVIDAKGKSLTPGLFGGVGSIGLEEVSAEDSTVDASQSFGSDDDPLQMRPEFDVTLAFNPDSTLLPVARLGGITFSVISAGSSGSIVGGQGGTVRLDGSERTAPMGPRLLFVSLGSGANPLSGKSRAGQYMLLEQAIREARGLTPYGSPNALLTPGGRDALAKYLAGGRVLFSVDRAADIRQMLAFSRKHGLRPIIVGGAEAWKVKEDLAAAKVPVILYSLQNLPSSFDTIGSRLDNATLLHQAGVPVIFSDFEFASHNARKVRQEAGNAVSHGLPWEAGLAGLTSAPAAALGLGDQLGRIEPGLIADLVLWDGDPLEVTTLAEQVWMRGRAMPMRSRQTELRDRYLQEAGALPRAYQR
jgi:hypothetical protein